MINGLLLWHTILVITKKWYGKIFRKSIVVDLSLLREIGGSRWQVGYPENKHKKVIKSL